MSEASSKPKTFDEVLSEELRAIDVLRARRGRRGSTGAEDPDPIRRAHHKQLTGLAFSGGGIRSATFNLGILQALAKLGLLCRFDYLSTVSGGGYIGSWLVAWIQRCGRQAVERGLSAEHPPTAGAPGEETRHEQAPSGCDGQPEDEDRTSPITVLRQYSNYLTPKRGLLSLDAWMAAATYIRNLLLNLTIIVLALATALLVPRLVIGAMVIVERASAAAGQYGLIWFAGVLLVVAIAVIAINLDVNIGIKIHSLQRLFSSNWILSSVALPLFLAAAAIALWLSGHVAEATGESFGESWKFVTPVRWAALSGAAYLLFWVLAGVIWGSFWLYTSDTAGWRSIAVKWANAVFHAFVAGALGGLGLATVGALLAHHRDRMGVAEIIVWGPPLVATIFVLAGILHTGLMGRSFPEENRQWWSRLGGWLGIISLLWLALFVSAFYAAPTFEWILARFPRLAGSLSLGWVLSTAGGVLAGRSSRTSNGESTGWLDLVARMTPYVFIVGLLILVSTGVERVYPSTVDKIGELTGLGNGQKAVDAGSWTAGATLENIPPIETAILILLSTLMVCYLSWRVDINEFSMHLFYRNRLVRAYLGSSRWHERRPMAFTGFDPEDDLNLSSLDPLRETEAKAGDRLYDGPLPILNTALNLTSGRELAWQERQAISFFFSPLHFGFERPTTEMDKANPGAYRPVRREDPEQEVSLGTALAVSGAAVNPSMGYHSSRMLAFLLTVFNARLGLWLGNPARRLHKDWMRLGPRFGIRALLQELLGWTGARAAYVNLSDGGHFDNLGIYELVRRRCRFIVVCDGEADPGLGFRGLGTAIRRCRSDFGVSIDIDLDPIRHEAATGNSRWHCAVGTIHYDDRDPRAPAGTLIYLKASMSGDEPADVLNYADCHSEFPHEGTGDQWFDESQFESYRMLGYHVARELFDAIDLKPATQLRWQSATNESLFVEVRQAWYPPSSANEESFTRHSKQLDALFERLRGDPRLEFLDAQFYVELDGRNRVRRRQRNEAGDRPAGEPLRKVTAEERDTAAADNFRAGFYLCNSAIQLMESVYLDLDLEHQWEHPDNRGWRNLFLHWSWSSMFRQTWAISASTYGARFQRFCEKELGLLLGKVSVVDVTDEAETTSLLSGLEKKLVRDMRRSGVPDHWDRPLKDRVAHIAAIRLQVPSPRGGWTIQTRPEAEDVVDIPPEDIELEFTIGLAVLDELADGTGESPPGHGLVYLRIRDHLRKLGLGRRTVKCLLRAPGRTPRVTHLDLMSSIQAHAVGLPGDGAAFRNMFRSAQNELARP